MNVRIKLQEKLTKGLRMHSPREFIHSIRLVSGELGGTPKLNLRMFLGNVSSSSFDLPVAGRER